MGIQPAKTRRGQLFDPCATLDDVRHGLWLTVDRGGRRGAERGRCRQRRGAGGAVGIKGV